MDAETHFRRRMGDRFVAERLPDGSLAIFDAEVEAVHSLNESATLVLEACEGSATVRDVVAVLERCTGQAVTAQTALEILQRFEAAELVVREQATVSRRSLLRTAAMSSAAALALPTLLTLTASEQRLHAQVAGSPTTTATPTTPTTTLAPTTTTQTTTLSPTTTNTTTSSTTLPPTTTNTTTSTTTNTTTSTTTNTTTSTTTQTTTAPPTTTSTTPAP